MKANRILIVGGVAARANAAARWLAKSLRAASAQGAAPYCVPNEKRAARVLHDLVETIINPNP
jgi:hypothetical protein